MQRGLDSSGRGLTSRVTEEELPRPRDGSAGAFPALSSRLRALLWRGRGAEASSYSKDVLVTIPRKY